MTSKFDESCCGLAASAKICMVSTVDPDVVQAQYFIDSLEDAAEHLVDSIQSLDSLMGGEREAALRRTELVQVRRLIDALRRRFASQT